eukprot:1799810-Pleurochrysis_carterae.AAC.8
MNALADAAFLSSPDSSRFCGGYTDAELRAMGAIGIAGQARTQSSQVQRSAQKEGNSFMRMLRGVVFGARFCRDECTMWNGERGQGSVLMHKIP